MCHLQFWYDISMQNQSNTEKYNIMNHKIFFSAIIFTLSVLVFSSCRKEDRPAKLHADTQNLSFNKDVSIQYFGIVNTGKSTMDYQIASSETFIDVFPSSGVLGFNEMAKIQVNVNSSGLGYGIHYASLNINSNGGTRIIDIQIIKPLPDPALLWWDIDYIKIPNSSTQDYITVRNDGEETLNYNMSSSESWMSFSQTTGNLNPGQENKIWVEIDRSGLSNNLYSGFITINSNGGKAVIDIDMEVGIYSVSFFNPVYTDISINVPGIGSQVIPVLNRVNYVYTSNPGNIYYEAVTRGETVNYQTLGLIINWKENINLSNEESPIFDLNISEDYFFLSAINYGVHNLDQWSINYDTQYQFDEDVNIPNDGYEYYFGYYDALDNSNVYARIVGTDYDAIWENGVEFDFPWVMNQGILLESDLKSSGKKSNRILEKSNGETASLKVTNQSRVKTRIRNASSLVNISNSESR